MVINRHTDRPPLCAAEFDQWAWWAAERAYLRNEAACLKASVEGAVDARMQEGVLDILVHLLLGQQEKDVRVRGLVGRRDLLGGQHLEDHGGEQDLKEGRRERTGRKGKKHRRGGGAGCEARWDAMAMQGHHSTVT